VRGGGGRPTASLGADGRVGGSEPEVGLVAVAEVDRLLGLLVDAAEKVRLAPSGDFVSALPRRPARASAAGRWLPNGAPSREGQDARGRRGPAPSRPTDVLADAAAFGASERARAAQWDESGTRTVPKTSHSPRSLAKNAPGAGAHPPSTRLAGPAATARAARNAANAKRQAAARRRE
jgi:hypothetical protein